MKSNYTEIKNTDITFCNSFCKNTQCSRNLRGEVYKYVDGSPYCSFDFSKECKEYK